MSVALQFASPDTGIAFLLTRVLLGAILVFIGLNHFLDFDHMTGYAEMKGLPTPHLDVIVSGGMLVFGGLGVALGVSPALAAGTVAVFLIVGTSVLHDFWAVPEGQRESEMIGFLKNLVILGGTLVFPALSGTTWSYAIGLMLLWPGRTDAVPQIHRPPSPRDYREEFG